jgi:hypothetical protein
MQEIYHPTDPNHPLQDVHYQRRMILEIVAPSLWCRRSVTKAVLHFLTADKVLEAATASKRLRLRALSFNRDLFIFSASYLVASRTRSQKDPYFGDRNRSQVPPPTSPALLARLYAHLGGILCGF